MLVYSYVSILIIVHWTIEYNCMITLPYTQQGKDQSVFFKHFFTLSLGGTTTGSTLGLISFTFECEIDNENNMFHSWTRLDRTLEIKLSKRSAPKSSTMIPWWLFYVQEQDENPPHPVYRTVNQCTCECRFTGAQIFGLGMRTVQLYHPTEQYRANQKPCE